MSSDVEDILILVDGRPSLLEELTKSPAEVRQYVAEDLARLEKHAQFETTAAGFARGDAGRVKLISSRIGAIAALAS